MQSKPLLEKIRRSLKRRGPTGFLIHALRRLAGAALGLLPSRRRARRRLEEENRVFQLKRQAIDDEFDKRFGVDTGGRIDLTDLTLATNDPDQCNAYMGIFPHLFEEMVSRLKIDFPRYTFVDIGSGKGRSLLLASQHPFRRIIGVEFVREFHLIAVENIRISREHQRGCRDIESVHLSALEFEFPDEPLVVYLYNPFGHKIMAPLLERLCSSWEKSPRDIVILYGNPVCGALFDAHPLVQRLDSTDHFTIYRFHNPAASAGRESGAA